MADMIVLLLIVLNIRKAYTFHYFSQVTTCFLWLQDQMNMILHQNIMVHLKLVLLSISMQDLKVLLIVNFIPEDIQTVVPPG